MFFIEDNILNESEKKYINDTILNSDFPFFLSKSQVDGDNRPFFSHIILMRPEDRKPGQSFNSSTGIFFEDILKRFCSKHEIVLNEFLRCCINISFSLGETSSEIHRDHDYDHKQAILYLNDTDGDTILIEKNNKETHVKPEKYKMICFEDKPHYMNYPTKGYRAVVVFTFR